MMTALEMVNMRVSYQVDVRSRESSKFHSRHHDAQTDRAACGELRLRPSYSCSRLEGASPRVAASGWQMFLLFSLYHAYRPRGWSTRLTHWEDTASSQVKFATCTLQDDALTWWNSHVKATTLEVAHAMPWAALKKMKTDKYCPMGEIKKIETEMWNLKVKGTLWWTFSRRISATSLMVFQDVFFFFPKEIDKIETYIGGLPIIMILAVCKGSNRRTMQEEVLSLQLVDGG
ncbi:hypothetical protein Tco_0879907 [Tanacetum coccineum]